MTNLTYTDPFTLAQAALFQMIVSDDLVRRLVRPGNRMTAERIAQRGEPILPADFPQLVVKPALWELSPHATSHTAQARVAYRVEIETGSLNERQGINPLIWAVFRALGTATEQATPLDLSFVRRVAIQNAAPEEAAPRGSAEQWIAICEVLIEMHFGRTTDLTAIEPAFIGA